MKKFTFLMATLFVATMVNAQITLEHTFEGRMLFMPGDIYGFSMLKNVYIIEDRSYDNDDHTYTFYDDTYSPIAATTIQNGEIEECAQNLFTNDNTIAFVVRIEDPNLDYTSNDKYHLYVKSITGLTIADLGSSMEPMALVMKVGNSYKLVVEHISITSGEQEGEYKYSTTTSIYSLPGNGEDVILAPASSKRYSRKIANNGKVFVETETNTYMLSGQEVK